MAFETLLITTARERLGSGLVLLSTHHDTIQFAL
jgi:hypothetical protein